MRTIELSSGEMDLAEYADKVCDGDPIVLTRNGEAVAALVAVDDLEIENWKLSQNSTFLEILEQSRGTVGEGGTYSHREVLEMFPEDQEVNGAEENGAV